MSVSGARGITVTFTGDVTATLSEPAAINAAAAGQIEVRTLNVGSTTITPPASGTTPTCCIIVPPAGNVNTITLKGIAADTGILLHPTDPTAIALGSPTNTFVITVGVGNITGLRLIWI
jgi:hypothetical protein